MNIHLNKNTKLLKKMLLTAVVVAGVILVPTLATTQVYADPPCVGVNAAPGCVPPAPAPAPAAAPADPATPTGTLKDDAKCVGSTDKECVVAQKDTEVTAALDCTDDHVVNPTADCNIVVKYVNPFIKLLSGLAIVAVIIGIVVGGIEYASSAGDAQQVAKAKVHIRNSIIGLLVFIFLYAILKFLIPSGING